MSDANTLVQQAKKAYTAGDKAAAKDLLLKAVDLDQHNEQAWMWMSAVVSSMEDQVICLENVLSINPNNEKAKKGLEALQKKLGKKPAPPPAQPAAPPPAEHDPFAGIDFNESYNSAPDNPFTTDHGWGDTKNPPAAPAQPARQEPAPPAAYGSGKQVQPPSESDLDDWINNMGIGQSGSASVSPFDMSAPAPSNQAGSVDDDPWKAISDDPFSGGTADNIWDSPAPAAEPDTSAFTDDPWGEIADPFGGGGFDASPSTPAAAPTSNEWASSSASSDPFGGGFEADESDDFFGGGSSAFESGSSAPAASSSPFGDASIYGDDEADEPAFASSAAATPAPSFDFGGSSEFVFDEDGSFFDEADEGGSAFDFEDDDSDPFADLDATPRKARKGKAAPALSPYYQQIPDELRVSGGNRGMMIAVAVLGVFNVLALVGVVLAL